MSINNGTEYILQSFKDNGIIIDPAQAEAFHKYYEFLIEKNKVMNLTGITDFEEVVTKHFIDSCLNVDLPSPTASLIDVGTGAGFPGVPLKILYPGLKVTLLDSLNKRINFLNELITLLGLTDIEAIHMRAEDAAFEKKYREHFDVAVSRAVANLSTLCEYCLPFVKPHGVFVSFKGDLQNELSDAGFAITRLGGDSKNVSVKTFSIPGVADNRSLIYIPKEKNTPREFPRKAGIPAKSPLFLLQEK